MANASRVLEIILKARDEAGKVVQGVTKDLGGLGKAAVAGAAVTAVGVGIAKGLNDAGDAAQAYGGQVSIVQRLTGLSAEESSKWTTVLGRFGVEGKATGMVMKTLNTAIVGHSKDLAAAGIATQDASGKNRSSTDVMRDLANYYSKSTDKVAANALAAKVLGKGYLALTPMLSGGAASIDKISAAALANGKVLSGPQLAALRQQAAQLKDNKDKMEGLTIQAGLVIVPLQIMAAQKFGELLGWFVALPGPVKTFAVGLLAVVAAFALVVGPILMALPAIVAGVTLVAGAFSIEGIAAGVAWIATLGPIALVIAAIALIAVGVFLIIKNWGAISAFFQKLWAGVTAGFKTFSAGTGNALKGVGPAMGGAFEKGKTAVSNAANATKGFLAKWGPTILAVLVPFIGIPLLIKTKWNVIGPFIAKVWDGAKTLVKRSIDGIIGYVRELPGRMLDAVKNLAATIAKPIDAALNKLKELNPFTKHSPSLVDNVLAGVAIIRDSYIGLSGMNLAAPSIGGLSGGAMAYAGGGFAASNQQPQAIHLYIDGRELNRGIAKVSSTSDRTGGR